MKHLKNQGNCFLRRQVAESFRGEVTASSSQVRPEVSLFSGTSGASSSQAAVEIPRISCSSAKAAAAAFLSPSFLLLPGSPARKTWGERPRSSNVHRKHPEFPESFPWSAATSRYSKSLFSSVRPRISGAQSLKIDLGSFPCALPRFKTSASFIFFSFTAIKRASLILGWWRLPHSKLPRSKHGSTGAAVHIFGGLWCSSNPPYSRSFRRASKASRFCDHSSVFDSNRGFGRWYRKRPAIYRYVICVWNTVELHSYLHWIWHEPLHTSTFPEPAQSNWGRLRKLFLRTRSVLAIVTEKQVAAKPTASLFISSAHGAHGAHDTCSARALLHQRILWCLAFFTNLQQSPISQRHLTRVKDLLQRSLTFENRLNLDAQNLNPQTAQFYTQGVSFNYENISQVSPAPKTKRKIRQLWCVSGSNLPNTVEVSNLYKFVSLPRRSQSLSGDILIQKVYGIGLRERCTSGGIWSLISCLKILRCERFTCRRRRSCDRFNTLCLTDVLFRVIFEVEYQSATAKSTTATCSLNVALHIVKCIKANYNIACWYVDALLDAICGHQAPQVALFEVLSIRLAPLIRWTCIPRGSCATCKGTCNFNKFINLIS